MNSSTRNPASTTSVPGGTARTFAAEARARTLLHAPIARTLVRLAAPGVGLAVFQIAASIADTHYVGRLGTEPLAALALVFPLVMFMQMASAGAMGGGVSSAIARALGAGDAASARNLVAHAVVIAASMGLAFTAIAWLLGPSLYRLLGSNETALAHANAYSAVIFGGAVVVCLGNILAATLRGSGNTRTPALALIAAALVQIALARVLTLGWGPVRGLGIAGTATAHLVGFAVAAAILALNLRRSSLWPRAGDWRIRWRPAFDILRVGAVSSLSALQTIVTAMILTGLVGTFGVAAIAGYGVGVRLELLMVPVVFSMGQALVVMVGVNIGAGNAARAKRIAWIGAGMAAAITFAIGTTAALLPHAWVRLFSANPEVIAVGASYLRVVGPSFAFFGLGMALYFASQGSGQVVRPVLAGTARLVFVVGGGTLVMHAGGPLWALFAVIAAGLAVFGGLTGLAVHRTRWGRSAP